MFYHRRTHRGLLPSLRECSVTPSSRRKANVPPVRVLSLFFTCIDCSYNPSVSLRLPPPLTQWRPLLRLFIHYQFSSRVTVAFTGAPRHSPTVLCDAWNIICRDRCPRESPKARLRAIRGTPTSTVRPYKQYRFTSLALYRQWIKKPSPDGEGGFAEGQPRQRRMRRFQP